MSLPPSVIEYQELHINDSKKPNLIAAAAICLSAAYVAVALRFTARRIARNGIGADDYTILLALFFTTVFVTTVMVTMHFGLGRHLILVTNGPAFGKSILAAEILYNPAILTTKISILLLYRRIFPVRPFVIILWLVGAFVAAYSLTAAMVNLLQCLPINADWNPAVKPRCVNLDVELVIVSSINVVTDFAILCLPMPLVWRLHTSKARKAQVSGMFLLGGFVCAVSIVRATYVSHVSLVDGSWADADSAIWSVVETCIAVVSTCLPVLRPLLGKHAGGGSSKGKNGQTSYAMTKYRTGPSSGTGSSVVPKGGMETRAIETDEERLVRGTRGYERM